MLTFIIYLIVGFVFGLFVYAQMLLPLIYGFPKGLYWYLTGRLRFMGVVRQLVAPLLWTASFFILGFIFQIFAPSVNEFLITNKGFNFGQLLSIFALILNFLSRRGRSDMAEGFYRSTIKTFGILKGPSEKDQICQVHKLVLEFGAMPYSYGYAPVEQWHGTRGFRQAIGKSFPNVETLLPNGRFTKNEKVFFRFASCEECRNEYGLWARIAGFEPHDCAILPRNLADQDLPDVMDRINWNNVADDITYLKEHGKEALQNRVVERMLPFLRKNSEELGRHELSEMDDRRAEGMAPIDDRFTKPGRCEIHSLVLRAVEEKRVVQLVTYSADSLYAKKKAKEVEKDLFPNFEVMVSKVDEEVCGSYLIRFLVCDECLRCRKEYMDKCIKEFRP